MALVVLLQRGPLGVEGRGKGDGHESDGDAGMVRKERNLPCAATARPGTRRACMTEPAKRYSCTRGWHSAGDTDDMGSRPIALVGGYPAPPCASCSSSFPVRLKRSGRLGHFHNTGSS